MKFIPTELPEVVLIEPDVHADDRGFFLESWHADKHAEGGLPREFAQDNHSRSEADTLRGLHVQLDPLQGKLIRATAGGILDVAVDVRQGSPTFGRHVAATLTAENFRQLWIPPGFAHGFCVVSDSAEVQYKCTAPYAPESEIAIAWDDPDLGIVWPIRSPRLSDKDRAARPLSAHDPHILPAYTGA